MSRTTLSTLREELRAAANQFQHLANQVTELRDELAWLRKRVASFHPERHHCPKCKAIVHAAATACRTCGASWGVEVDPRAGLPR